MDYEEGRPCRTESEAAIIKLKDRFLVWLAMAILSGGAMAQGEDARRLAAGLIVMSGDVRLLAGKGETLQRREGLRARVAGDLSSLPLLLRRAGRNAAAVPPLRVALAKKDWRTLERELAVLSRRHPLELHTLLPATPSPEQLRFGAAIHRERCAGCHDASNVEAKLPALNLFEQSSKMPRKEFAARLILGVRGNQSTAYRNPFSDLELGALISYYVSSKTLSNNR